MEDEGYTSPSEENFCYNPTQPPNSNSKRNGLCSLTSHGYGSQSDDVEKVPWDEIIKSSSYIPNRHFTWDNIQIPFPFRYHKPCHFLSSTNTKQLRRSFCIPYLSDDVKRSTEVADILWKSWKLNPMQENLERKNDRETDATISDDNVKSDATINELKSSDSKPIYISNSQFIQHALHLLAGRGSETFYLDQNTKQFRKNPIVLIKGMGPTSLLNYCDPILYCGSLVNKLSGISKLHDPNAFIGQGEINTVFNACLEFICDYFKLYQTILMLNGPNIRTLTELNLFLKPMHSQLTTLDHVWDTLYNRTALEFITGLNAFIFSQEDQSIEDLLTALFIRSAFAYFKYISDWIFRGILGPSSEFHIERGRDYIYTDRRFWTKQFVQKSTIPKFLESSAHIIFETGKSITLLNRINETTTLKTPQLFFYDAETMVKPVLTFKTLQQLTTYWNTRQAHFFEENAFLILSLESTIKTVVANNFKVIDVDFTLIDQIRDRQETKLGQSKLKSAQLLLKQKRKLMEGLQEQLQLSYVRKSLDENLPFAERRKFKKHQLEHMCTIVDAESDSEDDAVNTVNNLAINCLTSTSKYEETLSESTNVCFGNGDLRKKADCVSTNDLLPGIGDENYDETNTDLLLNLYFNTESTEEPEEKFNSDKVIVRKPPLYKTDYKEEFNRPLIPLVKEESECTDKTLRCDPYCLNFFLSQSIAVPLAAQNRMINAYLLHHFVVEKKLFHHIAYVNSFLCLQNGLFSRNFTSILVQEVKNGTFNTLDDVRKTAKLNVLLTNLLTITLDGIDSAFTVNLTINVEEKDAGKNEKYKSSKECSRFSLLNSVRLNYSVEWPLNIILTEDLLSNCERIFCFLMQLLRAEFLLEGVFTGMKCKRTKSKQLDAIHYCRYRLLHFVRTVRNYVNVTVIDTAWTDLCNSFSKMDSLDKIYDGLVKHIKSICTDCLLGVKAVRLLKLLTDQLVVIENFCDELEKVGFGVAWEEGNEIPRRDFTKLLQNFKAAEHIGKVFVDVACKMVQKGYYPKVDYFLKLYNFNGFFCQDGTAIPVY